MKDFERRRATVDRGRRPATTAYTPKGGPAMTVLSGEVADEAYDSLRWVGVSGEMAGRLSILIGGIATAWTGVGAVIAVATVVSAVMDELSGMASEHEQVMAELRPIREAVETLVDHAAVREQLDLVQREGEWSRILATVNSALGAVTTARTAHSLGALDSARRDLQALVVQLLRPTTAQITFSRKSYLYQEGRGHWIDHARSPFMNRKVGGPLEFFDPARNLGVTIWDAGFYSDLLVAALHLQLPALVAVEPTFRATGYGRADLDVLQTMLAAFVEQWRGSILVADPILGIHRGGHMQNPYFGKGPSGVLMGVVDPTSGAAVFDPLFSKFATRIVTGPHIGWYGPDYSEALDPDAAEAAAAAAQNAAYDTVVEASGIPAMVELQRAIWAMSWPGSTGIVDLPNPTFEPGPYIILPPPQEDSEVEEVAGPIEPYMQETIDLGRLAEFGPQPPRRYPVDRYPQPGSKTFSFSVARRADHSGIQLGYRLTLADQTVPLIDLSHSPPHTPGPAFPTAPRTFEWSKEEIEVADVVQTRGLSSDEEDTFERTGAVPGVHRLFVNHRRGREALHGEVAFHHDPTDQGYTGTVDVRLTLADTDAYPDGFVLPLQVMETRPGRNRGDPPTDEMVDRMDIHFVPTFLVPPPQFFDDWYEARRRSLGVIEGLKDRFGLDDLDIGDAGGHEPKWGVFREAEVLEAALRTLDALREAHPEIVAAAIQRSLPLDLPVFRGPVIR